jgi:DNA (cytosine-5)-methyltransferase 1
MKVIGSIYTGVTADFQRGVYPIARCVKAEQHDLGVVMADVNVLGSLEAKFESTNRIYDVVGCNPTLSTMQGGNQEPKILESQIVAMRGRNTENPSDRTAGSPTAQRLDPNAQGMCNSLTTVQKDNLVMEKQYRIRKLTPRECGRLMGVSDEDISKMAAVNSNTQLYKQFGNSIVVDVMCAMFKNLNIEQESEIRN